MAAELKIPSPAASTIIDLNRDRDQRSVSSNRKISAIHSLTTLRGLAASWVVVYHFQNDLYRLLPITSRLEPLFRCGNLAVPLFFILSGFVLSYNYSAQFTHFDKAVAGRFIWARLARIYPVHLATLVGVLAMFGIGEYLNLSLDRQGYGAGDFFLNLLLVHTWVPYFYLNWNYPSWSISSEWFAYLCFPFISIGINRLADKRAATLFLVSSYLLMQAHVVLSKRLAFRELLAVVGTFLTGCAIYKFIEIRNDRFEVGRRSPEILLSLICFLPFLVDGLLMTPIMMTLFALLIYLLVRLGQQPSRIWIAGGPVFVGEVSYSLYMVHTLVQKLTNELLPSDKLAGASLVVRLGTLFLYLAGIVVLTLLTYWIVEKPCRNWARSKIRWNWAIAGRGLS